MASILCKGKTKEGKKCSRVGKYDGYCFQHKNLSEKIIDYNEKLDDEFHTWKLYTEGYYPVVDINYQNDQGFYNEGVCDKCHVFSEDLWNIREKICKYKSLCYSCFSCRICNAHYNNLYMKKNGDYFICDNCLKKQFIILKQSNRYLSKITERHYRSMKDPSTVVITFF
jgi:hypothetical protein